MARDETLDELRTLLERHLPAAGVSLDLPVPGLALGRVDALTEPSSSIADPVIVVVAQGEKRLLVGDGVYDYGAGDYLVVTVDLPVSGYYTRASRAEPFLGAAVRLDPETIASLLLEAPPLPAPVGPAGPALGVHAASTELLDAMVRLVRLVDHPEDAPVLGPLVEREILWRLLRSPHGELVRQVGLGDGTLTRVGQAVRWIRDNSAEPFRVEDLADRASMSVTSFHRHFRAATALSPVQYQKKIRLQRARLLLAAAQDDVTRIAHDVGYQSPSQFSREYRREFGRPPGHDAGRLRPAAGEAAFL
jgi:AraC-like DNA-binding protein